MANSLMQLVSDGNLSVVPLTIKFFEQAHIGVYIDNVPLPTAGYSYSWSGATTLVITPNVAAGVVVEIRRQTPSDYVRHYFQNGAVFSESSIDENFIQDLFLLQEAKEQSFVTDLFDNLDMHGNKITNLGTATAPKDAVPLAQVEGIIADAVGSPYVRTNLKEAQRRIYAAAGFNMVGTFQEGFTFTNTYDVGIDESSGKGYTGPAGPVVAGTHPTSGPFVDVSNSIIAASGSYLAFSTIAALKNMQPLGLPAGISVGAIANSMARTISYHAGWAAMVDPVGGATYTLTTLAAVRAVRGVGWVPDGYVDHYLTVAGGATYVAVILTSDTIAIEQAGARPDNPLVDNYNNIQAAFDWANTTYGKARTLTAGVGEFYFSKTFLIKSLQPNLGICSGIDGAGWGRTALIKTANTPADGSADYSVDAYIAYETRSQTQTLYCYSSQLKNLTCKSTAPNRHAYGVYGKLITHFDWEEFEVQSAAIGVYAFDAWLMRWRGVRASSCDLGYKIGGTGTTLAWSNVWAHNCKDGGYDITGVVYAEWSNCAADNIYDPDNPTVNKVAYKFKNCQGIHMSGCGTENVSEAFLLDNSIVKATAFRVNSIRLGAAGQTLVRAINGAGGSFDSCGFTSVPATPAITVQSKDATSYLIFTNSAFQIANSGVPNDGSSRRNGLATNMPLDVQGLKTVRLPMNGATWLPLSALKSGAGFQLLAGVAENADRYITLTKPFWAYSEISTSAGTPTTIGSLANAAGVAQTGLRAYRAADAYGVETLYISFSGASVVTMLFTMQTAQHW